MPKIIYIIMFTPQKGVDLNLVPNKKVVKRNNLFIEKRMIMGMIGMSCSFIFF